MPTHRWGDYTPSGHLGRILDDETPQLGGTLDANGNTIDMGTNTITDTKVGQWDTAYGWGDHGAEGYLTAESDTLDSVTDRGATTTNAITVGGLTSTGNVILNEATPRLDFTDTDVTDSLFNFAMAGATMYVRSRGGTSSYGQIRFQRSNDGSTNRSVFGTTTGGDVLFYDDDGSTEGMRWDASANRLGIGISSPAKTIDISSGAPSIRLRGTTATETITDILTSGANDQHLNIVLDAGNAGTSPAFLIKNYTTELLRLTSAGNLGIATGSPSSMLQVGHATTVDSNAYITFGKRVTSSETNLPFIGHDDYTGNGASNDLGLGARSSTGTINFYTGNTTAFNSSNRRMSIESNGDVNIANDVDISGNLIAGDGSDISMDSSSSGQIKIDGNGYDGAIALDATAMHIYHNSSSRDIIFGTNESEKMRIKANGYVGLGITPTQPLHVEKDLTFDDLVYFYNSNSSGANVLRLNTNGGGTGTAILKCQSGGVNKFVVDAAGNAELEGKLTITDSDYDNHIELNRSSEQWRISPSTDGSLDIRRVAGTGTARLDILGNATVDGSLTVGDGTNAADHIAIKPADDGTSDDLQFYNGTTRMGEIGTQDTTWLRINQSTAKNIYTPRYIRADGGFFVDGTAKGINGSGNFIGGTVTTPSLTTETASGPAIYIKDTSGTGATNHNSWLSFRDSGGTELGYVGYGSSGNSDLTLSNYNNGVVNIQGTKATVITSTGYIDIGSLNTSHAHFYTDRGSYYFNKLTYIDGSGLRGYDSSTDCRFPLYYDLNDTSYYCDPASTSRFNINYSNNHSTVAGAGYGLRFWNSDSYKIYMSAISDSTWGGDVPGSNASDYAMYFRMSSGTNRGFIFRNNTLNVAKIDGNGVYSGSGVFGTGQYLDLKYNASGGGGVRLYDSDSTLQGYWYGNGSGEHGFLDNDGAWAVRIRTGTNQLRLQTNNNNECMIYTSYVRAVGSCRSPIFYDFNNTSYYAHLDSTGDSIRAAGDIVAYYSDERLKDIEGPIENALDKVSTLNGFYYRGNEKAQKLGYDDKLKVGLSAQEVQKVLPEVIKSCPADNQYMTLDYSKVVPLLIEAIKELKSEIEELKK